MKIGRFRLLLLTLAFLASQLIAVVHTTNHELNEQGSNHCQICSIAHAAPIPPSAVTVPRASIPNDSRPLPVAIGNADRRRFARPNNRGPPSHLV